MTASALRLGLGIGAAVALLLAAWGVAIRGHLVYELATFRPPRAVSRAALQGAMRGAADVRVVGEARGETVELAAWYAPPAHGAVVLVAHGSAGTRASMAHEANALADAGLGVLAFDFPGHGESGGDLALGEQAAAVEAAAAWLRARPEVSHVGALGFSMGVAAVIYAAAEDPSIEAVVAVAGFTDALAQTRYEHGQHGFFSWVPPVLLATAWGLPWSRLRPVEVVARIAPRPLLLIHGTSDPTIPVTMSEELYARAGEPRTLWRIEGGSHGELWRAAGAEYDARLVRFFAAALGIS